MIDLLQEQEKLQKEAKSVLEKLDLVNLLNKYGNTEIVGSLDYGLMTWRDIDINVATDQDPKDEDYWKIVKELFSKNRVKLLTLADNRKNEDKDRPKSMYIGLKYQIDASDIWKIDIRFLSKKYITTDKTADLIKQKITDDTRKMVLEMKSQVHNNPKYHKEFSSLDIYEAVLLNNVKSLSEFKTYLESKGKGL